MGASLSAAVFVLYAERSHFLNVIKAVASYHKLREQPVWRLLAANNAPEILALLQTHLLDEKKGIPASVLYEYLEKDLETLRAQGEDLPQTAQAYASNWLADGYLVRRFPSGAAEEQYELTAGAATAIRFINSMLERRTAATESRLSTVIQQLTRLAEETEPDVEKRITTLLEERDRIDREIAAVQQGHMRTLPEERALERIRDTLDLAGELASDFRYVRDEFDKLNRELRERIMDDEGSRGQVLDALFAGVDLIGNSEAGRTFHAFWNLLTDPEQNATLDAALDAVLSREFACHLQSHERRFLLKIVPSLLEQGRMVHDVLQYFARSLKQFVQSREYLEQKRINNLLKEAQCAARELKENIKATDSIHQALQLTSVRLRSVDQWVLFDPSENTISKGVSASEPASVGFDIISELVAHSEINFRLLEENIRAALKEHKSVTVAEVIQQFPANQGLGSVVGYLALGSRYGVTVSEQSETVHWKGEDGPWRCATIPTIYFHKERLHEL